MKMESTDGIADNIRKIAELFPQVMTEVEENGVLRKAVNFDKLKQLLSAQDLGGTETYEFTWVGKRAAMMEANTPIRKTLRPCPTESKDWDTTQNLYIEGDNLEVLKLLQESYLGKVKMIYIDPPYNTGNDFIYKDKFSLSAEEYDESAEGINEDGDRLVKNTDTNGRFHSDWCSMIYSRLLVARDFLAEDGVVFVSIDENEISNLKSILDEVFGERNFIAQLIWAAGRKNDSKYVSISHEYIVAYFKNVDFVNDSQILWRERKQGLDSIYAQYDKLRTSYGADNASIERELRQWYKALPDGHPAKDHAHYNNVDDKGIFFASDISWPGGGGPKYNIKHPITGKNVKIPARGWITNENTMKEWVAEGRVYFGADESKVPTLKAYLRDKEMSVPYSVFYKDGRAASKRLATLMGEKVFENPKDEEILQRIIEFVNIDDTAIIMDFFSGSATAAHAVFLANCHQNTNKKFILVQIPEVISAEGISSQKAKKVVQSAISLLDTIGKPHNICEIGKERIRRAGEAIKSEMGQDAANMDVGFRVFKVDDSNMSDVYYSAANLTQAHLREQGSNIKSGRKDLDLFFGCILDWGLELSLPYTSEELEGCTVHIYNDGDLVACFANDVPVSVVETIAKRHPLRAVFRDSCFADSPAKINVYERFKLLSPDTTVKVI